MPTSPRFPFLASLPLHLTRLSFRLGGLVAPRAAARRAAAIFRRPRRLAFRPELLAIQAEGSPRTLAFRGQTLRGWEWTPPGAPPGAPLVLLQHGWEGRSAQFAALVPPLLAAGFRALAFDAPGHGESPPGAPLVSDVAALALEADRGFGPFAAAIGHSAGGAGLALAAVAGLRARRLVLVAAPSSLARATAHFAAILGLHRRALPALHALIAAELGRPLASLDLEAQAPAPGLPVLLLHDPRDAEVPASEAAAVAGSWPEARLRHVVGVGHRRILSSPAAIGLALAFLEPERAREARPAALAG